MQVFRPGTMVRIAKDPWTGDGGFIATVIAVMIETDQRVSYKVAWWDGRSRTEEWLSDLEVNKERGRSVSGSIGFVPEEE